jgi:hypothetical protein
VIILIVCRQRQLNCFNWYFVYTTEEIGKKTKCTYSTVFGILNFIHFHISSSNDSQLDPSTLIQRYDRLIIKLLM